MNLLAEKIIPLALDKKITIASSESITGGRIASALTSIWGSSKVFMGGIVAYSEHAKIHSSGVDVRTIKKYTVYSRQVVIQMAERIRSRNTADIAVATTGCAEGDCDGFGVGRVIIALAQRDQETEIFDKNFPGNRNEIQDAATQFALEKILERVEALKE